MVEVEVVKIRNWGGLVERIGIIFVGMAIGIAMYGLCSCAPVSYENGLCGCEKTEKEISVKAKMVLPGEKDPPWCEAAVKRGYFTSREILEMKKKGHIRWVEIRWEAPPGQTWERVIVPRQEDRFRYMRSDFRTPTDNATIDVVMFDSGISFHSTKRLVVKAKLGSYSPAMIYQSDIFKAYDRAKGSYLKAIGEQI